MSVPLLDREGFVMIYRRVFGEIHGRLSRRKAHQAALTYALLLLAADYKSGFVPGSIRGIAEGLLLPRKTFSEHVAVLQAVGEVEVNVARNQHQDRAGILVVHYDEVIGGRNRSQRAGRDADQHRAESGPADTRSPAETPPQEVEELRIAGVKTALMQVFDYDEASMTRTPKGWLTRAAKDIVGSGGTPAEVAYRFRRHVERFDREPVKPVDLANAWPRLQSETVQLARDLRAEMVPIYGEEAVDEVVAATLDSNPDEKDVDALMAAHAGKEGASR